MNNIFYFRVECGQCKHCLDMPKFGGKIVIANETFSLSLSFIPDQNKL